MSSHRPLILSLGLLQIFIALGAVAGGLNFILDLSGGRSGLAPQILAETPFKDFLVPGLYLLVVNGIGSLAAAILSLIRHPWAPELAVFLGLFLMGWIAAQLLWLGFLNWTQPFYFALGFLEAALGGGWRRLKES